VIVLEILFLLFEPAVETPLRASSEIR